MAASSTLCMESDAALPHPLLTKLTAATAGCQAGAPELGDADKAMLLADAETCIKAMRGRRDDAGWLVERKAHTIEPGYVAAALALMCGYFRKKNGTTLVCGPSGAAAAFGHEAKRADHVTDKMARLERLEAVLRIEVEHAASEAQAAGTSSAGMLPSPCAATLPDVPACTCSSPCAAALP